MNEAQEMELINLRAEVEVLRHVVAQLLKLHPSGLDILDGAIQHARAATPNTPGVTKRQRAMENAHNRLQTLLS